jgi:hypothetical protein
MKPCSNAKQSANRERARLHPQINLGLAPRYAKGEEGLKIVGDPAYTRMFIAKVCGAICSMEAIDAASRLGPGIEATASALSAVALPD